MKRSTLYTIAVILAIAALFVFLATRQARAECEVCVAFHGRSNCATARGATTQAAQQGAQTTACGPLVQGMDETIACGNTEPAAVRCKT